MRNLRLTLAGLVTLATIGTVSLSASVGQRLVAADARVVQDVDQRR